MKHFIFLAVMILLCSCAEQPAATYMIHPHEELPKEVASDRSFTKIFLAGTIDMGNSIDWQQELYSVFCSLYGRFILFNPRQEHWDADRPGEMDYQVRWELEHLEDADIIIMNILGNSKSPISLLEMGLHAHSGKMHVICEPDFYRHDNVRITCDFYGIPLYPSMDSFLKEFTNTCTSQMITKRQEK